MATYKLFPTKDTTIYSEYPSQNTGLDSILEASVDTNAYINRYLIQFSQDEINSLINNKIGTASMQANLKTYIADIENLNTSTVLETFAVYNTWNMGTGRFNDTPRTDNGCSWVFRSYSGSNPWLLQGNFPANVTGSYGDVEGGGNWYYSSNLGLDITPTQTYNYTSNKDLNTDVTGIVKTWYSQSSGLTTDGFNNNGFIIKQSTSDEIGGLYKQAKLTYYSIDTNTIYPPELYIQWEDHTFDTGSSNSTIIATSELVASLDNNPGVFRSGSVHRFNINCRPQFPSRVYQTSSMYTTQYYLPPSSSYAVKDLDTNEYIVNFDDSYTRISADATSSYFNLYMNGFEPERYYQILIKVPINGQTLILDDNYYFKIING